MVTRNQKNVSYAVTCFIPCRRIKLSRVHRRAGQRGQGANI